jgi:hypothetical protein
MLSTLGWLIIVSLWVLVGFLALLLIAFVVNLALWVVAGLIVDALEALGLTP